MSHLDKNINAFVKLGKFLDTFRNNDKENHEDLFGGFRRQLQLAEEHNGWFTKDNLYFAINQWARALSEENLSLWMSRYTTPPASSKKVAVVMAGNIPLVGFHDFMSVLICGHSVVVRQSSGDKHLLPYLAGFLEYAEPSFRGKITFTEDRLDNFDAVIATGSDNTSRYFEYYFGKKPHIIRKNRNSAAVLTGRETKAQLTALGEDIFRYFGLGCRNVSKLFVPKDYDFDAFFRAIYPFRDLITLAKYANNYDYNKAVYLMSLFKLKENGFLMLKEDSSYASPIATLFYETYTDPESLREKLAADAEKIQCVVARGFSEKEIPFGKTQTPELWDYADGVDTVEFLLRI